MISDLIEMAANVGMVIGPCIGYFLQIQKMTSTQSAEGFSTYVSFILILSNVIRVFWWQAARFSTVILVAAILMVACQFMLLYFSVQVAKKNQTKVKVAERNLQTYFEQFWQWDSFGPYIKAISMVITFFGGLTMLFSQFEMYGWLLGMLSSGIEALIGTPQFKLNFQRKNTKGLSIVLICMWLFGDLYKLSYYQAQQAPVQLFACAGFQVLMDIAILSQFWIYREQSTGEKDEAIWQISTEDKKQIEESLHDSNILETASSASHAPLPSQETE